jgi:Tol biopolymer transport system component
VNAGGDTFDIRPSWSPDGTRIAFYGAPNVHGTVGARGVWVADADGTARVRFPSVS